MDRLFEYATLSPYTGFGYRFLYNDLRGASSTGAPGYRRESNYYYLPLGVIYRQAFNGQSSLTGMLEYDQLLFGRQVSRLSDTGLGLSDVTNNQSSGYGLRLGLIYEINAWAIGPYLYYWNIGQSDTAIVYKNGTPYVYAWEPANNTTEFGLKAVLHF